MIGNPSFRDFEAVVRDKMIANCPVHSREICNASASFGCDLPSLWRKKTRCKPKQVRMEYVAIPQALLDLHVDIMLVAVLNKSKDRGGHVRLFFCWQWFSVQGA